MIDNWLKPPVGSLHAPLQGDHFDTISQMTMPQHQEPTPERTAPVDQIEALAQQLAERAIKEKLLSQRAQDAVAHRLRDR